MAEDAPAAFNRNVSIYPRHAEIIQRLADERFDGNFSLALRMVIRHYESCQFPALGIPQLQEQEQPAITAPASRGNGHLAD